MEHFLGMSDSELELSSEVAEMSELERRLVVLLLLLLLWLSRLLWLLLLAEAARFNRAFCSMALYCILFAARIKP